MKDPQNAYKTGESLLIQSDADMASVYFENASENFLELGDRANALKALEKALYCYELLERADLLIEVKRKISSLLA